MPRKPLESLTESMFYVLMAFQKEQRCGTVIASFVEQKTHGLCRIGPATLYTILAKFEDEKYIKEVKVEGRKRTYAVTDKGRQAYVDEVARLRRCVADAASEEE